jgi:hypothetical protein
MCLWRQGAGSSFCTVRCLHICVVKSWLESALWKSLDWSSWSNTLAAKIPDLTLLNFFMGSDKRDHLRDQSTHERGTAASDYGCYWLHMRMPWNDSRAVNSYLELQGCALRTVVDILSSYKIYLIKCSNKLIWLILCLFFLAHPEIAIALQWLEIGPMLY